MKIEIITFHNTLNYGATLQCTAFSKYLSELGHEVEVINYLPEYVLNKKQSFKELKKIKESKNKVKAIIKGMAYFLLSGPIRKKDKKFEDFLDNNISLSKKYYDYQGLQNDPPHADLFFCGSDQIWNPSLTGGQLDESFFLKFTNSKKASYGASLGENDIELYSEELNSLTADFLGVSVREKSVSKKLSEAIGREVKVVLDCTLLVGQDQYKSMESKRVFSEQPYLLLYNVQSSEKSAEIAKQIASEKNLIIIDISPNPFVKNKGMKKLLDVGPGEFLTLVKNASFVVTNSFHGTAFSIIYEKNFFSLSPTKRGGRILDLLVSLELDNRLIRKKEEVFYDVIDYKKVKVLLDLNKEKSTKYIDDIIREVDL